MCTVIWPDWPWPSPPLDPPAPPPALVASQRPDEAPVSHPHPSVPQKRPSGEGRFATICPATSLILVGSRNQHTEVQMARVKIEDIVDHLSSEMRRALEDAVKATISDAEFDSHELYRSFRRAVGRKCSTWEQVPDHYVELDT